MSRINLSDRFTKLSHRLFNVETYSFSTAALAAVKPLWSERQRLQSKANKWLSRNSGRSVKQWSFSDTTIRLFLLLWPLFFLTTLPISRVVFAFTGLSFHSYSILQWYMRILTRKSKAGFFPVLVSQWLTWLLLRTPLGLIPPTKHWFTA